MQAKRVAELRPEAAKLITQMCVRAAVRVHRSPTVAKKKPPARHNTKN